MTAVRLSYNQTPNAIPEVLYTQPIAKKELHNIKEGVGYLHAQFKNEHGWGPIAHFRVQIDEDAPRQFTIECIDTDKTINPRPTCLFNTTDDLSGIGRYKVKVGESAFEPVSVEEVESNPYTLPPQPPGRHTILVQAFDAAGNYTTATSTIEVLALPAPTLLSYPSEVHQGDPVIIKGSTEPNARVTFKVQGLDGEPIQQSVKSDQDGNFTFVLSKKLDLGTYTVWADITGENGAMSTASERITVAVTPSPIAQFGSVTITALSVIVPAIGVIVIVVFGALYARYRLLLFQKRISKHLSKADVGIENAFSTLGEHLNDHIQLLEKTQTRRRLTEEERHLMENMKKEFDVLERVVRKKVKGVSKEVEKEAGKGQNKKKDEGETA